MLCFIDIVAIVSFEQNKSINQIDIYFIDRSLITPKLDDAVVSLKVVIRAYIFCSAHLAKMVRRARSRKVAVVRW